MTEAARPRIVLLGAEGLGRGDEELGRIILANFLKALVTNPLRPDKIICWNTGVRLLTAESPVVGTLQDLEGIGVEILACKTCVDRLGVQDALRAGEVSTMPAIADLLLRGEVTTV